MSKAAAAEPVPEPEEPQEAQDQPEATDGPQEPAQAEQQPPASETDPEVAAEAHMAQVHRLIRDRSDVTSPARYQWEAEQVAALRGTVAKDCSPAEFVMFLEVAARYQLDPFAKQIWAAKMPDGQVAIIVGRDGLMSIAERHQVFEGVRSAEVVQGDKLYIDERGHYVHEWGEQHLTGRVIGAWAEVTRTDRPDPIQFYARMSEYEKSGSKIWQRYKTAMIVKCAQSTALRMAFSISGVVIEEEVGGTGPNAGLLTEPATIDWGDDEHLALWLKQLVARANDVKKHSYRERKLLALLRGRTDEERRTFAQELTTLIVSLKGEVPEAPEELRVDVEDDGTLTWEVDAESRFIRPVVEPEREREADEPEPVLDVDAEVLDGDPEPVEADAEREGLGTL